MRKTIQISNKSLLFEGPDDRYLENLSEENEFALSAYIRSYIPKNAIVLDIGANVGFISALISVYNPTAVVFALEPGEQNFGFLEKNVQNNELKNVNVRNIACGDSKYYGKFYEDSAWGYLDPSKERIQNLASGLTEVTTIDDFVAREKLPRVDLIKIDVEGFEKQVLDGLSQTLKMFNPKVIMEFNTYCLICHGRQDPFEMLTEIKNNFKNKFRFNKSGDPALLLQKLGEVDFEKNLIHSNIIEHGSVDDLLLFN